ncbi:hypothetical protein BDR26DRAFT_924413 [Obelidium mucronatum]|nr:hypothetical protein BDR26DRAFT_924413 [Obelidium mucronatum]
MATSFSGDTIVYFGTGGPGDPSPLGGKGSCGRDPANPNYFAAVTPELYNSRDVCGLCAQITCPACSGRTVTVEIIDTCPSCVKSADAGSLSISLQAMGDLLGGQSKAVNAGVIRNASWQLIACPASLGPNQSPVSGGGVSTTSSPNNTSNSGSISTTAPTSPGSSTGNTVPSIAVSIVTIREPNGLGNSGTSSENNLGPILGGSTAAVFLLLVVGFVLWLKHRTAKQEREHAQTQIINRYGAGSVGGSSGHPTLRRNTSVPDMSAVRPASGAASEQALVVPAAEHHFLPAIPISASLSMDRPPQHYYPSSTPSPTRTPPIQQQFGAAPLSPGQPLYGQPQSQPPADYSKEWAEYFKQHPEEYERYYGTPMPR